MLPLSIIPSRLFAATSLGSIADEALKITEERVKKYPDSLQTSDVYMKMGKDEQAEDALLMAICHDRENDDARESLKKLLKRRGK
ncbi:MAG: hypothetical protein ACTSSE_05230 [Candidatus Thorarchaeota archaeon]